jgi:predicted nucleotidyltransferase
MATTAIELPTQRIADICRQFGVQELSVFGSALREDFDVSRSDVDFLVTFKSDDVGPWMEKYAALEDALSDAIGHRVDVVDKRGVEQSPNYIRRNHILGSARVLYVA